MVMANTVGISLIKTVLSLALAILLAWIIARTDTPWRGTLEVLVTLPFFIPPILTATAWAMLGNAQVGTINLVWRWLTGLETPIIDVYSYGGVVWHMMQYSTPFIFLFVVEAFRAMDPSLEESSRMSGRHALADLLARHLRADAAGHDQRLHPELHPRHGVVRIGGVLRHTGRHRSIDDQDLRPDRPALAAGLSVGNGVGLRCHGADVPAADHPVADAGRPQLRHGDRQGLFARRRAARLDALGDLLDRCISAFFVLTVVLPIGQLLLSSFFQFFGFYQLDMLTLDHYRAVWENREFWSAFGNTMLLGVCGATATMVLGAIVAYVTTRTHWRGRRLIDILAWLPWMMPGMVLGVGFLWAFAMLPGPIPIYGTIWALLLAYMALGTPIAVRVTSSAFAQISYDIEECSRVHGASWWQTLWRILIALAWPSFAVGWVLTFFGIMRELSASILLYAPGTEVLSVEMLKMWAGGKPEEVSVIGLIMLALVLLFRWVQLRFIKKRISTL